MATIAKRNRSRTAFFSHDFGASQDPKIVVIEGTYNNDGYANFFKLIEFLCSQKNYVLPNTKLLMSALKIKLKFQNPEHTLEQFLADLVEVGLLRISKNNEYYSDSLLERMAYREERLQKWDRVNSAKAAKEAAKGGRPPKSDLMAVVSKGNWEPAKLPIPIDDPDLPVTKPTLIRKSELNKVATTQVPAVIHKETEPVDTIVDNPVEVLQSQIEEEVVMDEEKPASVEAEEELVYDPNNPYLPPRELRADGKIVSPITNSPYHPTNGVPLVPLPGEKLAINMEHANPYVNHVYGAGFYHHSINASFRNVKDIFLGCYKDLNALVKHCNTNKQEKQAAQLIYHMAFLGFPWWVTVTDYDCYNDILHDMIKREQKAGRGMFAISNALRCFWEKYVYDEWHLGKDTGADYIKPYFMDKGQDILWSCNMQDRGFHEIQTLDFNDITIDDTMYDARAVSRKYYYSYDRNSYTEGYAKYHLHYMINKEAYRCKQDGRPYIVPPEDRR